MSLISKENFQKTLTQQNGERTKVAVRRWSRLLENAKDFGAIRTKAAKETTAMLLENQYRFLNEAATNTSIFGPQNGLQGGALHATDGYAPGDNRLPRILIPMVRRIYPALMSNEVVGVQPMPGPVALGFALRYKYLKGALHAGDSDTRHVHEGKDSQTGEVHEPPMNARGIKGIETKYRLDETAKKLYVIDGQGYPVAQPLAFAQPTADGKFIAVANPLVESICGSVTLMDGAKLVNLTKDTAEEAITLGEDAVIAKFAEFGVPTAGHMVGVSSWNDTRDLQTGKIVDGKVVNSGTPLFGDMASAEMGYQKLDTRFTGRQDARLGEKLAGGRWQFRPEDTGIATLMQQYEGTGAIAKTSFGFEKCSVEAGTRRLSTSWTLETEEDLKNTNGIDIEQEATQQMSYELQAEIDREMTVRMLYSCLSKNEWSLWDAQLADARWLAERQRAFYQHLIKMSIRMQSRNRRGPANFIVCTPDVAALLETLQEFVTMPAQSSVSTGNMATAKVGTLGGNRFSVYVDTRTAVYDGSDYGYGYEGMFQKHEGAGLPNYCLLGYKGAESYDAGIIYCPYIPIMVQQAVNPVDFTPQVGLMTRYGVLDNIFGAELYYHCIIIDSFAQPGMHEDLRKVYPAGYITPAVAETMTATETKPFSYPVHQTAAAPQA